MAEVLVMFLFMLLPELPRWVEALVDGALLSILVAPALYQFLYKPLTVDNSTRKLIEKELRRSRDQLQKQAKQLQDYSESLEEKVDQRTLELTDKNTQLENLLEELHRTQVQMVQNEKMTSLGQMVAGISHEINNPVSFIYCNFFHIERYIETLLNIIQLYQKHYPNPVPDIQAETEAVDLEFVQKDTVKILSSMQAGTERIHQIVLSLRNFSRIDESEFKAVNIHEGIDSALMLLEHRLHGASEKEHLQVVRNYAALPEIECHPSQLNQVFMHILSNAVDVMEETLETSNRLNCLTITTSLINDDWIRIAIADTGPGIPNDIKAKMFDPFFTTKHVGEGTGIGLSISHQIIVDQHGGTLDGSNNADQGAEFVIQLPINQS